MKGQPDIIWHIFPIWQCIWGQMKSILLPCYGTLMLFPYPVHGLYVCLNLQRRISMRPSAIFHWQPSLWQKMILSLYCQSALRKNQGLKDLSIKKYCNYGISVQHEHLNNCSDHPNTELNYKYSSSCPHSHLKSQTTFVYSNHLKKIWCPNFCVYCPAVEKLSIQSYDKIHNQPCS